MANNSEGELENDCYFVVYAVDEAEATPKLFYCSDYTKKDDGSVESVLKKDYWDTTTYMIQCLFS